MADGSVVVRELHERVAVPGYGLGCGRGCGIEYAGGHRDPVQGGQPLANGCEEVHHGRRFGVVGLDLDHGRGAEVGVPGPGLPAVAEQDRGYTRGDRGANEVLAEPGLGLVDGQHESDGLVGQVDGQAFLAGGGYRGWVDHDQVSANQPRHPSGCARARRGGPTPRSGRWVRRSATPMGCRSDRVGLPPRPRPQRAGPRRSLGCRRSHPRWSPMRSPAEGGSGRGMSLTPGIVPDRTVSRKVARDGSCPSPGAFVLEPPGVIVAAASARETRARSTGSGTARPLRVGEQLQYALGRIG